MEGAITFSFFRICLNFILAHGSGLWSGLVSTSSLFIQSKLDKRNKSFYSSSWTQSVWALRPSLCSRLFPDQREHTAGFIYGYRSCLCRSLSHMLMWSVAQQPHHRRIFTFRGYGNVSWQQLTLLFSSLRRWQHKSGHRIGCFSYYTWDFLTHTHTHVLFSEKHCLVLGPSTIWIFSSTAGLFYHGFLFTFNQSTMYLKPISIYYLAEAMEPLVVKLGCKWLPGDRDSAA